MEDASLPSRQKRTERQRVDRVLADVIARLDELDGRLGRLEAPVEADRQRQQDELDRDLIDGVRGLFEVDRAVAEFRRRQRDDDWPSFQIPPAMQS
jgi:hypothetical protein